MTNREDKERQVMFDSLTISEDCDSCTYLIQTMDVYATTDSPTKYECSGSCYVCPILN